MTNPNANKSTAKTLAIVAVVAIVAIVIYGVANMPDRRTPGEKLGAAVSDVGEGIRDGAREMQDRTPGERAADAVRDAKEDVKDAVNTPSQ